MAVRVTRETVNLADYPDLVVIYLGMRVTAPRGMRTLATAGRRIRQAVIAGADGLLRHETVVYSLVPPHAGLRQYWRDFDALERWARSDPHRKWWTELLADSGGTSFWHETYFARGGVEAIYLDLDARPLGFSGFAPRQPARKSMFSARHRLGVAGPDAAAQVLSEDTVYRDPPAPTG